MKGPNVSGTLTFSTPPPPGVFRVQLGEILCLVLPAPIAMLISHGLWAEVLLLARWLPQGLQPEARVVKVAMLSMGLAANLPMPLKV